MGCILLINADPTLKRLVKLSLPGLAHVIHDSATLEEAHTEHACPALDLVIVRVVARDDQGPERLEETRNAFPNVRLLVAASLYQPELEADKFRWLARSLNVDYCLIEPISPGHMVRTVQSALATPKRTDRRSGPGPATPYGTSPRFSLSADRV